MQRTLVMIRHAKSSWANPLQSDFDRPLNERGKKEVAAMGGALAQAALKPDLIIASTAKRTRQTAKKIAEALGYSPDSIRWEEKLYHCIPSVFDEVIYEIGEAVKTVIIVAHNPGITGFVNQLSAGFSVDNMPTCGIVAATLDVAEWNQFSTAERKIILFKHPENNHDS